MLITAPTNQVQLEAVFERILNIRRITRQDQKLLMSALLSKEDLNEQEMLQINKVFQAVQGGLIKVVD
ncbi:MULTISPECIES: hypothetical protein [unclassified Tolypothrix]|uniref:hypothetical protein n=1 Tax=unclassified Tolypothrix TaxID=2649714 RepID=UPI0005EAAB77|nr:MULTISPECIES: hypothetical protein [unclassified Tolypothrix]BAY88248.1 hypothetical protein NIES3275_02230 [Microchaete diplosiphon NIES-3275]EKF02414.1 hypothetical protein FDUTEX481_07138 [Tolypothrix sp. PCC 7601]MBE9087389.1 hypothetical protein [Tolypothrix sp. LEGE 11397]UYD28948.1 hypothetical protein HGR01_13455 [Tolypothrix sp. PCC 7712]UYD35139.1 hypothetical protein HG267_04890 [Tolypothrix sp. PCC 7601]